MIICGPVQDERYYAERVAPHVDGVAVRYWGNVGGHQRVHSMSQAVVLLHPLGFDEPFGLSIVEAMVCRTPVVGYRRGALHETVDPGVTGFLVDDIDAAVSANPRALALDQARIARWSRKYLAMYEQMLAR